MKTYLVKVITPKHSEYGNLTTDMFVKVTVPINEDPILWNDGQDVQIAFLTEYGVDLRAMNALNVHYLKSIPSPNTYEITQIKEILAWEKKGPSYLSRLGSKLARPILWLINRIIPSKVIKGVLSICLTGGKFIADKSDILREGNVSTIEELKSKDLGTCDKLADGVHNWAIALATAEGAATGVTGIYGLALDIPALITLAYRTIIKIGYCYGYTVTSYEDKLYLNQIMTIASSDNLEEKTMALATLVQLRVLIAKEAFKKMAQKAAVEKFSKEAVVVGVRKLAGSLGVKLTRRKLLQGIPMVGGAVGAAMNANFIQEVGWAARRMFQKRWLEENGIKIPEYNE